MVAPRPEGYEPEGHSTSADADATTVLYSARGSKRLVVDITYEKVILNALSVHMIQDTADLLCFP